MLTLWILFTMGKADASLRQVFDAFIAGHYEKAEAHLQTLLKTSSDKDQIHFLLGRLAAWDGRTDDAFDHFEKAAKFSPQNADYYWWLAQMYGQKAIKASIFRKPGHARNTKKSLEKAIVLDPEHIDARFRLMGYHLYAPGSDRTRGNAYNRIGEIYLHQNEIQKAREAFQTALKWRPKQESARKALEKLDKEKNKLME